MNNFKVIQHLKINWLKNTSDEGGAMKMVIDSAPEGNIIINLVSKKHGRMWADVTPEELKKITTKDNGIYEVITAYPHKLYFDIDMNGEPNDNFLNTCVNSINELFPDGDLAISGSITDKKTSYHVVLNNYMINSKEERGYIKGVVNYLNENVSSAFDTKVYTNNRNMKCINQSKGDKRIQKLITNDDINKHFITCYLNNNTHELPKFDLIVNTTIPEPSIKKLKLAIEIEKSYDKFDVSKLPNMNLKTPDEFDIYTASPLEILNLIPLNKSFSHSYTHYVCRYCNTNLLTFDNFYNWYKLKNDSIDNKNKWLEHWNNIQLFPNVKVNNIIFLLCKFYPNLRQHRKMKAFQDNFDLASENIIKVDVLTQEIFNNNNKFTIINTGMGSGKTTQTIDQLRNNNSFIWMTPNVALAQNTHQRMTQNNIKCCYYKDTELFKSSTDKCKMNNHDNLIVCINSLHYITKKYKTVVIDEIESLLGKWHNNDTFNSKVERKIDCWKIFIDIIRNADKVILLDAFTSKLTINFINNVVGKVNFNIYELNNTVSTRNVYMINKHQEFINNIIEDLKANKKLFIFYPYKSKSKYLPSMVEFNNLLTEQTGKTGIYYNADVDDKVLKTLDDVNKNWIQHNFIITNTKITVGINLDVVYFDKVYAGIAGYNLCRDVIQATYRCRNLNENSINICFFDRTNTNFCFLNDQYQVDDCLIYKNMTKDILIEKQAPLIGSLYHFCKKANYKICPTDKQISDELSTYINKMLADTENIFYSYDTIPTFEHYKIKEMEQKLYSNDATLDDKMTINKYYFNLKFAPNVDKSLLAQAWDENYNHFFDKMIHLKYTNDNIFQKIKEYNSFSRIFPSELEIKYANLSDEILTQIFNEYHFSRLTKKSTVKIILKFVYNTYFNKTVITLNDVNRNDKISINENATIMYKFGTTYLNSFVNDEKKPLFDPFDDSDDEINLLDVGIEKDEPNIEINYEIPKKRPTQNFIICFD